MSRRLAYVTDLAPTPSGGGSYAVNWNLFSQLRERFETTYVGPLTPRPAFIEQTVSRFNRRILHRPGKFAYFSGKTLDANAAMVNERLPQNPGVIVFRSAARWCRVQPKVPYFVYLDAVFHTFFFNTFSVSDFDTSDLQRIWDEEAAFLENAAGVFFESRWGLEKAREAYGLSGGHYSAPGRGGVIAPPAKDTWDGQTRSLVTMAMNFRQKGGDLVLEAYRILKPRYPSFSWHVIGAEPEGDWRSVGEITYEGVLNPDKHSDLARLQRILGNAFLLVHPTREDTSPLVITEAGYFGCPSVSVKRFAIPELVIDGQTGILLESPVTPDALAAAISGLLEDRDRYSAMRINAREHAMQNYQWSSVGKTICDSIAARLAP